MGFEIEKGVPMPVGTSGQGGVGLALRALAEAKIGDSVLLTPDMSAGNPEKFHMNMASRATAIMGAGKYACRREGDGVRVWKTA